MRFKSRKSLSQHHTFVIDLHVLSPWPSLHGPLVVEYQRGNKRRGHSNAAEPIEVGTGVTRYEWDSSGRPQQFVIDATLYPGKDGALEQKLLNIFVCQVDEKGKPGNMVGGVTLDLAQLVGLPEQAPVRQEYGVECAQSIVEMAGGRPQLVIGLSQQGHAVTSTKRGSSTVNAEEQKMPLVPSGLAPLVLDGGDEVLPSRLSTEVPSSERRMDELEKSVSTVMSPSRADVAKRGFLAENGMGLEHRVTATYDEDGFLVEDEDERENPDSDRNADNTHVVVRGGPTTDIDEVPPPNPPTTTTKNLEEEFRRASVDEPRDEDFNGDVERVVSGMAEGADSAGGIEKVDSTVPPLIAPDLSPFRASNQKPVHHRRFSRDINSSFGSMRQLKGEVDSPSVASCGSAMKELGRRGGVGISHDREELEILAALEVAVWCAGYRRRSYKLVREERSSPSKINGASNPHLTAARRLARTVIALGETEGPTFAKRAVTAIKAACASSLGDVRRLVLWWAALITLRVRFFTLTEEDGKGVSSFFGWLKVVSPIFTETEDFLYTQIVENVWESHLAPVLGNTDIAESSHGPGSTANGADIDDRIASIVSGLDAAMNALHALTDASVSILKTLDRLVLEDIAVKLDVSLLKSLLISTQGSSQGPGPSMSPIDSTTGLEIKILVSKLVSYLESHGVEGAALPRMDSLSNVLVSHKESLLDAEVRKAIAPRISLNSIVSILHRYTMSEDEGSPEDLAKILDVLKTKASTIVDLNATYEVLDTIEYTLPDDRILSQQGVVQSLSLEMSEDSEDEIEELIGDKRKGLLLELWGLTGK